MFNFNKTLYEKMHRALTKSYLSKDIFTEDSFYDIKNLIYRDDENFTYMAKERVGSGRTDFIKLHFYDQGETIATFFENDTVTIYDYDELCYMMDQFNINFELSEFTWNQ